jgi:hypothetical protein
MFDTDLLKSVVAGKTFDPDKEHGADGNYGKYVFAEKVIKPQSDTIDFSGFVLLLDRIVAVLQDYETRILASAIALPQGVRMEHRSREAGRAPGSRR